MKFTNAKYFIVSFLLAIFLLKGLETMLPLFAGHFIEKGNRERQPNKEAENSQEKAAEKVMEKEFLSHFFNDYTTDIRYILISTYSRIRNSSFKTAVFLPVFTPPPEFID